MSFGKIHRVFIRGYQRGGIRGRKPGENTWVYPYIYCFQNACHIRANHNRAKTRVIFAFILIGTRQNALYFNGFEAAAPCKGRGISAQGRVNGVNDTLGPPHDWVLLHSRPVGAICRKWGNAPRHTRGNYRANHTVLPIYYIYRFQNACHPPIYVRGMSGGGGVAPIPTFCPYRARYLLNPGHGGTQGRVNGVNNTLG